MRCKRLPPGRALAAGLLVLLAPAAVRGAAILDGPITDEVASVTQSGCPCKPSWSFGAFVTGITGCSNPDSDLKVRLLPGLPLRSRHARMHPGERPAAICAAGAGFLNACRPLSQPAAAAALVARCTAR